MASESIQPPFPSYFAESGAALQNGSVFIGEENKEPKGNPITVYWDSALTKPASQPIEANGGYLRRAGTPARIFTSTPYSITVEGKDGTTVYTSLAGNLFTNQLTASVITYVTPGGVTETLDVTLNRMDMNPEQHGADPLGIIDATPAFNAMFASTGLVCGRNIKGTSGATYLIGDTVVIPKYTSGSDTFKIDMSGVLITRVAGKTGPAIGRVQDSLADYDTSFGNPKFEGGHYRGDNTPDQFGLETQQSKLASFKDVRVTNCDAGFVGTFGLETRFTHCESINCRTYGFLIRSGSSINDDGFNVSGSITSITDAGGGDLLVDTGSAHGLVVDNSVNLSATGETTYDKAFLVKSVSSPSAFTVEQAYLGDVFTGSFIRVVWANAAENSASTASNINVFDQCRIVGIEGMRAGITVLGSDSPDFVNRCVIEGNGDLFGVEIDTQGNTSFLQGEMDGLHLEGPKIKVLYRIKATRHIRLAHTRRTHQAALADFSGSVNLDVEIDGIPNLGSMPKPAVNIAYATASDGSAGFSTTSFAGATFVGAYIGTDSTDKSDTKGQIHTNYIWEAITSTTSTIDDPDGGRLNIAWGTDANGANLVTNSPTSETFCGVFSGSGSGVTSTDASKYTWLAVATDTAHIVNTDAANPLGRWWFKPDGGGYGGVESGTGVGLCIMITNVPQTTTTDVLNGIRWETGVVTGGAFKIDCSESAKQPVLTSSFGLFIKSLSTNRQNLSVHGMDLYMDGDKVMGPRVIESALANSANTGDANTDALLDGIRDLIIEHGFGKSS